MNQVLQNRLPAVAGLPTGRLAKDFVESRFRMLRAVLLQQILTEYFRGNSIIVRLTQLPQQGVEETVFSGILSVEFSLHLILDYW